jgi:flagellar hook-length control protein FliK
MNVSENIVETGYSLRQFDNGSAMPKPLSGVATVLKSDPGSDLSNSETIAADLLREQIKSPGNFNDDINFRTRSLTDILPSEAHEVRTIISGAGLSPEASSNKDNASRASLLEPNVGLSSVSNSESKPSNWANATQATQQPQMTKPSEIVSSTELATHLRVLKSSGGGEAKLQLHPAELGRMTVSVITEGDEARVSFVVDNSQAKYSVEASLPRLRDLMDASGLSLMDADVSERHSKKDEEQPSDRLMEEALSSSAGGESESLEEVTPPNTSQLLETFA